RSRKNRIAAEEIDLHLHRITEPSEDVDVVPTFFIVSAGRIIIDADLVIVILIESRIKIRLENSFEHRELALFLGLERLRIVEHFSVPVAENVAGKPSVQADQ